MKYVKSRSLRYLFLLLTLGVTVVALGAADSPVPTKAALQPQQRTQPPPKRGLPNYDIRLVGKTGFDDFDLTSTPGRARAQQNAHARARLAAVDQFLNARPDAAQNLRALANETGAMKSSSSKAAHCLNLNQTRPTTSPADS